MRELAVCISNDNQNCNAYQTIDAIVEAGFPWAFVQWYDKQWQPDQLSQLNYAREKGLKINFAHLGYQNINTLWDFGEQAQKEVERYKKDLNDCHQAGIDLVIMHLHRKYDELNYGEVGYRNLKEILEEAERLNMKVAFENTRSKEVMDCCFGNVHSSAMGYCHDAGHCHAFYKDKVDWDHYGPILAVHLHDNHGGGIDEHLLPGDGTIDWDSLVRNLVSHGYDQQITLELCYQKDYLQKYTLKEFYKEGYQRGLKLAQLFEKYDQKENRK